MPRNSPARDSAICETAGFPFFGWYFHYNLAIVAAGRGRFNEAYALPRGVTSAARFAHHPRTLAALGEGRFDLAFRHAAAMSPPGVRLALGEKPRRTGSTSEASRHLLEARDRFAAMAATPWPPRRGWPASMASCGPPGTDPPTWPPRPAR
jgi:hypothetical protein